MKIRLLLLFIVLTLALEVQSSAEGLRQDAPPDVCQQPENILPNCNFDNGTSGWQTFIEEGSADFSVLQGGGECHAPLCPAGYIVTQNYFVGGIFQQVPVVKGNTYYGNIVWLVFDSLSNDNSINSVVGGISRKVGIDPFGGADPRSPNIIWGPENTRNDCKICASQEVTATAQADTITLFLRIDDRWRQRAAEKGYNVPPSKDQFWLDDFGLKQVAGSAAPAAPPPTDTPVPPPTDTPIPEPPTATPLPATEEVQAEAPAMLADAPTEEIALAQVATVESISPVATPTPPPVKTVAPPPTLTPSATPSPTATFEPRKRVAQPTPNRTRRATPETLAAGLSSASLFGVAGTTLCIGGPALLLLGAVMAGLVWLYRLGWGKTANEEADKEEIIIEIETDDR
ncbi:MAG: hypothetical protein Fur0044_48130 [Anaerolineae bacterium]|nr:hypothetical protein [Anaerolineales bacterium]MCQ3979843.1 hypothetical protein [Anaerolineae bacterium]